MKKLFSAMLIFIIILSSVTSIYAAEKISFSLNNVNVDNNRLFTVEMTANCSSPLSAASFEISYDGNMIEYRDIKTDSTSKISANEVNNKIKVVYLNTYGKDISNGKVIFSITFKALKAGKCHINYTVSDCVDADVKSLDFGNCTSGTVTINGKSDNKTNDKSENKENSKNDSSKTDSMKSEIGEEETTVLSTYDELGMLNPIDDSNTRNLIIGICIGVSAMLFIFVGFTVGKRFGYKKDNEESSDE